MSYVDKHLLQNEQVLYRTIKHWVIFLNTLMWFIIAGIVYLLDMDLLFAVNVLLILGLISFISDFIRYKTSEFAVTNKRVIAKEGFIRRRSLETLLQRVESIIVNQSILGRIFDFGTIVICGTGGSKDMFYVIQDPFTFRKKVQEQIEKTL